MNYNHLLNAHDKLVATEPHRTDEISAMRACCGTVKPAALASAEIMFLPVAARCQSVPLPD